MGIGSRFRHSLYSDDGKLNIKELLFKLGLLLFMGVMVAGLYFSSQWSFNTVIENRQKRKADQAAEQQNADPLAEAQMSTAQNSELETKPDALETESGGPFSDFQLSHWNGDRRTLSGYSGNVVLLTFWKQDDEASLEEAKSLSAMEQTLEDPKNVRLLNISVVNQSVEQPFEPSAEVLSQYGLAAERSFVDTGNSISTLLLVKDYPTTFVFDRRGKMVDYYIGSLDEEKVREVVSAALKTDYDLRGFP